MPLSKQTLDGLLQDYARLLAQANEAAALYQSLRTEATRVGDFLRASGRDVQLPDIVPDAGIADADSANAETTPDVGASAKLSDAELDDRMFALIANRNSGFKPSEMYSRLKKEGTPDDGNLQKRVADRLSRLQQEGKLKRRKEDNRYLPVTGVARPASTHLEWQGALV